MLFCGLKLTHDASVALIDGNDLVFCTEAEKLQNNTRHSVFSDTQLIDVELTKHNSSTNTVQRFVVDGWEGETSSLISYNAGAEVRTITVAPYKERALSDDVTKLINCGPLYLGDRAVQTISSYHVAGHILSAYCTSPFAQRSVGSYVLVWDGGMFPCLYYVNGRDIKIECFGKLFFLFGNVYSRFATNYPPFQQYRRYKDDLSVAGKLMAYIALGVVKEEIVEHFNSIYTSHLKISLDFDGVIYEKFVEATREKAFRDVDVLASFHHFLSRLLAKTLMDKVKRFPRPERNLCFSGGCALNIKWNSMIRELPFFNEVWVPPFPNDSGSAIGAACTAMVKELQTFKLGWNPYSGPSALPVPAIEGWKVEPCTVGQLAGVLHQSQEPIIILHGKAELGPRALGHRSIVASAANASNKDTLNTIKDRELYRPVAPICLEEQSSNVFTPGGRDQYMLFEHHVKDAWKNSIPVVVHLDGSSRLQTVGPNDDPIIYQLLTEYHKISGIPVVANTSANYHGKGFFTGVKDAADWGRVNYIWSDFRLYTKTLPGGK